MALSPVCFTLPLVGDGDGAGAVVGARDGDTLGTLVLLAPAAVGAAVGERDGDSVGKSVGATDGNCVGAIDGYLVGNSVGASVGEHVAPTAQYVGPIVPVVHSQQQPAGQG